MSMLTRISFYAVLAGMSLVSSTSLADFILSFDTPSQPVLVPLVGTNQFSFGARIAADVGTETIRSYDLLIDLQPPAGKGLPTGWSVVSITPVFSFPGSFGFVQNTNPGGGDAFGGDGSVTSTATFDTTPTTLFNVNMELSTAASPGDYTAAFIVSSGDLLDAAGQPIPLNRIQANPATISLMAVPEPGSLALLTIGLAGLVTFRGRRI